MPRTLPWLNKGAAKIHTASLSPAPKRRKRSPTPSEDLVDANLNDIATPPPRTASRHQRADRTPSTSPVAAPSELNLERMRPGYAADDIYMMVEDEFHAVAKEFTQQIHHAEYVRLKKLHRSRGEKILGRIGHGTDGRRTARSVSAKMRGEREERERRVGAVLDEDGEGGIEEGELPFMQDPQLAGLMGRERGVGGRRTLAGVVKAKSNTRAAAGFAQSPHTATRYRDALRDDEEDEGEGNVRPRPHEKVKKVFEELSEDEEENHDDDLDAAPAPVKSFIREPKSNGAHKRSPRTRDSITSHNENPFKRFAAPSSERSPEPHSEAQTLTSPPAIDDEDFDNTPRPRPIRPTYKKALNRQASQAAANAQSTKPPPSPSRSTGHSTSPQLFRHPLPPPSSRNDPVQEMRKPSVPKTSPTKTTASTQESQGTSDAKAAAASSLAKRAAERAKKEKEMQRKGKGKRVDEIPTFLF